MYKSKRYGKWEWYKTGNEEEDYKYVGEIKNGEPNGRGVSTNNFYPRVKYVGEWKDGKEHGQGTLTYTDRRKYVGEWKNGKYDGQGTYTWSNGEKYVGEWKEGVRRNGTSYDENGNLKVRYVNGKRIKP